LVNADTLARLKRDEPVESIVDSWTGALDGFKVAREAALLYR
jgi:hypothetical protein